MISDAARTEGIVSKFRRIRGRHAWLVDDRIAHIREFRRRKWIYSKERVVPVISMPIRWKVE